MKPRYRGVSHQIGAVLALIAGALVISRAPTTRAGVAGFVFVASMVAQFTISSAYHRGEWSAAAERRMRRLDHGCIYVMISGSYTPFCMLALDASIARPLLAVEWGIAAIGMLFAVFWTSKPRWILAAGYVLQGWVVFPFFFRVIDAIGPYRAALMFTGGILYSIGALVYVTKRPDPAPKLFGFHEVFHALVVLASVCTFAVVSSLMLRV